ncbi:MAG: MCE family protein [Alphaproteobacteria bacterium]|nr:MCE family protein [Alphaproteobacteria bacterium]
MNKAERAETSVGVFALLAGAAILALTATMNRVRDAADDTAMSYVADFARVDGIRVGTPVRLAGVDVGTVSHLELDDHYRAVVTLTFTGDLPLPEDSAAIVETDGIFGQKYIELQPGGSESNLARGGKISFTQDSVIIEDLVSRIVQQAKATQKAAKDKSE